MLVAVSSWEPPEVLTEESASAPGALTPLRSKPNTNNPMTAIRFTEAPMRIVKLSHLSPRTNVGNAGFQVLLYRAG